MNMYLHRPTATAAVPRPGLIDNPGLFPGRRLLLTALGGGDGGR